MYLNTCVKSNIQQLQSTTKNQAKTTPLVRKRALTLFKQQTQHKLHQLELTRLKNDLKESAKLDFRNLLGINCRLNRAHHPL